MIVLLNNVSAKMAKYCKCTSFSFSTFIVYMFVLGNHGGGFFSSWYQINYVNELKDVCHDGSHFFHTLPVSCIIKPSKELLQERQIVYTKNPNIVRN